MRLLIVTQAVDLDDPVLGFFHRWIEEFARQCDHVLVVCLREGEHELPENVRVHSLGKEQGGTRVAYLIRYWSILWKYRTQYDAVFVHMNPEYVVFGGLLLKLLRKRITLWYTHKSVTTWLRTATALADAVVTASADSFRIRTSKVAVVGHGIDTARFHPTAQRDHHGQPVRLVSVGRISEIKQQEHALYVVAALLEQGVDARLTIIGSPLTDADRGYKQRLVQKARELKITEVLEWAGALRNEALAQVLPEMDFLVHTSDTGSLDKVVLEALACGVLPVTTSGAVCAALPQALQNTLCSEVGAPAIASRIQELWHGDTEELRQRGSTYVDEQHELSGLITRITTIMKT
jgi:glycosyltransferase involved in cell wall biosynthesis